MQSYEHAFSMLERVFYDKGYSTLRDDDGGDALAVKLFYGVLEHNISLDYYVSKLTEKRPKRGLELLVKIGFYALKYLSAPPYAVTDKLVTLAKTRFSAQEAGFLNALLNKFQTAEIEPPRSKFAALSVASDKPEWLVRAYSKQYKGEDLERLLFSPPFEKEHIRVNAQKSSDSEIAKILNENGVLFETSGEGFFVSNAPIVKKLYSEGKITYQSLCSVKAARAVCALNPSKALDMCSAPGGKALFIAEKLPSASVVAWDNRTHRVKLIESYKKRMGVKNVAAAFKDAAAFDPNFENAFDAVLADVPCSGFGVASKKPDVYLNRSFEAVGALAELQYKILCNAVRYARPGGAVVYSTCTTLREENYNNVGKYLKEHDDAELLTDGGEALPPKGFVQYLPDGKGVDGFFIAVLRKK